MPRSQVAHRANAEASSRISCDSTRLKTCSLFVWWQLLSHFLLTAPSRTAGHSRHTTRLTPYRAHSASCQQTHILSQHTKMACPLLDKLPSELRKQIYECLLNLNNVPLRHATQLQPFVKRSYTARESSRSSFLTLELKIRRQAGPRATCHSSTINLIDTGILHKQAYLYRSLQDVL